MTDTTNTPTPRIEEAIGGISSGEFELMQKCSRVIDVGRDLEVELTAANATIARMTAELAAMRSGEAWPEKSLPEIRRKFGVSYSEAAEMRDFFRTATAATPPHPSHEGR